jgi:hypothetical protein
LIGTADLPRISCANHKTNLAVKTAIKQHKIIPKHFRLLNIFISKIKKSIELNKVFANQKCRLRLENSTRWGSGFLMLEKIKIAYKKKLFDQENKDLNCPVPIALVNTYLLILKPCYLFNINLQRNNSSIAEIIPAILNIINKLETISKIPKLSSSCQQFCELLIAQFKKRFSYELDSEIYQVIQKYLFILL